MIEDEDDMSATVAPKSEQLQADDLVGGRTVTIKINGRENKKGHEQPLSLFYDGDNGKPFKPSKGMRHVLIGLYGKSSKKYVGHSLTLYRDEKVTFGPDTTGGVRISHATGITEPRTIIIPVKRGIRKPFTVKPLVVEAVPTIDDYLSDIAAVDNVAGLQHKFSEAQKAYKSDPRFHEVITAKDARKLTLSKTATGGTNA